MVQDSPGTQKAHEIGRPNSYLACNASGRLDLWGSPSTDSTASLDAAPWRSAMTIELDRQFVEYREDKEQSDPDLFAGFGGTAGTLRWTDLLVRRRVVFLAEAGSGKTTEMKARAKQQVAA